MPAQQPPKHVLRSLLRLLETPRLPEHLARKAAAAAAASNNNKQSKTKLYNNAAQAFLKQQYRRHRLVSDNSNSNSNIDHKNNNAGQQEQQQKIDVATTTAILAQNYLQLQQDLAERARLYELDTGAEQVLTAKEMSRRAAARAGLALPLPLEADQDPLVVSAEDDEKK